MLEVEFEYEWFGILGSSFSIDSLSIGGAGNGCIFPLYFSTNSFDGDATEKLSPSTNLGAVPGESEYTEDALPLDTSDTACVPTGRRGMTTVEGILT